MSEGKKEPIKIFEDPAASSTPEKLSKAEKAEKEVQAAVETREQTSQVEKADTAQARAEEIMYGEEEDLPLEYWKELAEKRREALEASLIENEELHTSLSLVEDEKTALVEERDELKVMAGQAEELARIVKELVKDEDSEVSDSEGEEEEEENE